MKYLKLIILNLLVFQLVGITNELNAQTKKINPKHISIVKKLKPFKITNLKGKGMKKVTAILPGFSQPTEIEVEVKNGVMLWQGDIVIRGDQIFKYQNTTFSHVARPDLFANIGRWENSTMPFDQGSLNRMPQNVRTAVRNAIDQINENTNVCIIPRTNEGRFIEFERTTAPICGSSPLGAPIFPGTNIIRINPNNMGTGCIIHELMHSLGFHHEHTRSDRNEHVQVLENNILEGFESQFEIPDNSISIGEYDLGSIMHYRSTAFGKPCTASPFNVRSCANGTSVTIRSRRLLPSNRRGQPTIVMGQRNSLSAGDIEGVNSVYEENPFCKEGCATASIMCVGESRTVRIRANRTFNWTNVFLRQGDTYRFTTSGRWNSGNRNATAVGYRGGFGLRKSNRNAMALIGEFFDENENESAFSGRDFLIGNSGTMTATRSGFLMCFANDNILSYGDNRGFIDLTIRRVR